MLRIQIIHQQLILNEDIVQARYPLKENMHFFFMSLGDLEIAITYLDTKENLVKC